MIARRSDIEQNLHQWLVAFLIWPVGTLVASVRVMGTRVFSVVLVLFYFLYGFTYVISGSDQDTFRVSEYFAQAASLSFSDLADKFFNLYQLGSKPDIFQDLLQFLLSRVTNDVHYYFAATAVLFALVTAAIFEDLFKSQLVNVKSRQVVLIAGLFLLVVLSPGRINSFRHYFATALFLFSSYRYLTGQGNKYLAFLMLTPLIHFAFIMALPLVMLYKVIGTRFYVYYVLIALSFIYSSQISEIMRDYTTTLDANALQYHAAQYTSDVYLKQVQQLKVHRSVFLDRYTYYTGLFFSALLLSLAGKVKLASAAVKNLFAFALLIFAFVNVFSGLESVANRFNVLYQGFCCIFLIHYCRNTNFSVHWFLKYTFAVVLVVNAVIVIRILMQSASISSVLLFFPISFFESINVSILDWIKS